MAWATVEKQLQRMPQDLSDDKSTLVQVMAWCRQPASHYLSQCWPRSLTPYGVTRPQWVYWYNYRTWLCRIQCSMPHLSSKLYCFSKHDWVNVISTLRENDLIFPKTIIEVISLEMISKELTSSVNENITLKMHGFCCALFRCSYIWTVTSCTWPYSSGLLHLQLMWFLVGTIKMPHLLWVHNTYPNWRKSGCRVCTNKRTLGYFVYIPPIVSSWHICYDRHKGTGCHWYLRSPLLTWLNFYPSMDK